MDEASVKQAFPGTTFFAVRYRQYPVAIAPPEGLTSSNVLAVGKGGKVQVLKSPDDLPKFFLTEFQASKQKVTKETAQTYTKAWLNLVQELLQDGFYSFEIVKADAGIDAARIITATGRSMVTKGGNGEINVTIEFRADGGASADHKFNLIPGPRPKCQATKLLDPDPIVRHMAHSELLFMGMAARPYLLEQRDQASDARLRLAIDRVLQRIEAAGR